MKTLSGSFRMNDLTISYDFQLMGNLGNDVIFRMKFNKTNVDPTIMFIAGLMLMHFLANDFGCRIDISEVPKLADEQADLDAVEKYEKGDKQ